MDNATTAPDAAVEITAMDVDAASALEGLAAAATATAAGSAVTGADAATVVAVPAELEILLRSSGKLQALDLLLGALQKHKQRVLLVAQSSKVSQSDVWYSNVWRGRHALRHRRVLFAICWFL